MSTQTASPRSVPQSTATSSTGNMLIILGLVAGGVLGMAGTFVKAPNLHAEAWTIDGVGVIIATVLLALRFFRQGVDLVAGGFLIFALGESVMSIGNVVGPAASSAAFQAGAALWAAGLLLTAGPKAFALPTRLAGLIAGVLFAVVSVQIAWGNPLTAISQPLPSFAYPFLVLTFAGWIWHVAKRRA